MFNEGLLSRPSPRSNDARTAFLPKPNCCCGTLGEWKARANITAAISRRVAELINPKKCVHLELVPSIRKPAQQHDMPMLSRHVVETHCVRSRNRAGSHLRP